MSTSDIKLIEGFENLTPQQCFDLSLVHVRSTRQKSVSDHGRCVYSGIGCAAAPFIEKADREKADLYGAWDPGLSPVNADLIRELQFCHDDSPADMFIEAFETDMKKVARKYGLAYSPEK